MGYRRQGTVRVVFNAHWWSWSLCIIDYIHSTMSSFHWFLCNVYVAHGNGFLFAQSDAKSTWWWTDQSGVHARSRAPPSSTPPMWSEV